MIRCRKKEIPQRCLILATFCIFTIVCCGLVSVEASLEDDAGGYNITITIHVENQTKFSTHDFHSKEFLCDIKISKWADKFGEELWDLGKRMTKAPEIKSKYKEYNARVEHKDGEALLKSIVKNVETMLMRKVDAINCILKVAEDEAEMFDFNETSSENYTYYSSKYSTYDGYRSTELVESLWDNEGMYLPFNLNQDTHFYNISVNTTHSAVHVPSNIYDKNPDVMEAIQWSESLDKIFVQNYNSDPALSWQYFGSDTGVLRLYPAMQWDNKSVDVYDCRKRSWYIETATCSKDIVILVDNSGSMTGFRQHIAKLTIRSILDTFSNNDFINIFNYSATVDDLIPCFRGTLVQATPENIDVFTEAVKELFASGYANVSRAFDKAFDLLEKYRIERRCNESSTGCNQAIMLITDGLSSNVTEIVAQYDRVDFGNSSKIPVRIFTYLLGKEVTKVQEIQEVACRFRGYYSHIQTLDQVQEEVLKYVNVIAVPLVLQGEMHPPTWTHAFADMTYEQKEEDTIPRLMIAVGVPVFDRKMGHKNGTRHAQLLGVAGTDIPIEDIDKLSLPYMLGVNGYSFIVSNNGYVLLHPDLRPVEKKRLKRNYNSIDFTEVEQINDGRPVRDPGELLLDLRYNLVNHQVGNVTKIPVKFNYDNMRRVSPEYQDYFYAPLKDTPFSLGLVLPSHYGKTWIKVGDEVKRNQHMNINISDFFVGENWKVHPLWVYCKYHYLEGHEFKTPEAELRHFLKKMNQPNWEWKEQYQTEEEVDDSTSGQEKCYRKTLDDDAYYCNKELVQLLIFDAKVTNTSYGTWRFSSRHERQLIERYNATLRFVATMSGLTRWQFIFGEVEVDTDQEFGDYHKNAIDETWYKSAILQHSIDSESFVYSVPHLEDPAEEEDRKVTSSHAIFPRDGGLEAPGCVVGFQFSHSMMWERFYNITSEETCNGCVKTCNSDEHDCYVIDNNGYVVISENLNDTGRFFGEIEGAVMDDMVQNNIFRNITVFDLQGLCSETSIEISDATQMRTPIKLLLLGIDWFFTEIVWYWSRLNMWIEGIPFYDDPEQDYDTATIPPPPMKKKLRKGQDEDEEEYFNRPPEKKEITNFFPCDRVSNLYILQQDLFMRGNDNDFDTKIQANCSRPYHVKRIPKSNLLLVVIKTMYHTCYRYMTASPQILSYEVEPPCHKLNLNHLPRRRLDECFTEHPDEEAFTYCGDASSIYLKVVTVFWCIVAAVAFRIIKFVVV